jgi:hypothetical protein
MGNFLNCNFLFHLKKIEDINEKENLLASSEQNEKNEKIDAQDSLSSHTILDENETIIHTKAVDLNSCKNSLLSKTNHTDTEQNHPDSIQSTEMNKHYEIDSFSSYTKNKLKSKLCNINEVTQFDVIGKHFCLPQHL